MQDSLLAAGHNSHTADQTTDTTLIQLTRPQCLQESLLAAGHNSHTADQTTVLARLIACCRTQLSYS
eukprot:1161627-Pelagomonas_calceolata.AAC.3